MRIAALGVITPSHRIGIAELPERAMLTAAELGTLDALGIDTVGADNRPAAELAADAARVALDDAGVAASEVDALVYVQSRVPEQLMVSEATRVQAALGATRATVMGIGELGCVSVNSALLVSDALLRAGAAVTVLLVHGSVPPAPRRYRHPVTVNGTGGVAVVLRADDDGPGPVVRSHLLETNGEYWDLFGVEYKDRPVRDWVEACRSMRDYSFRLAIESRNRFRALNEAALLKADITPGDVASVILQNLSAGAFRFYEETFGLPVATACKDNLRAFGHLGSMDILLNLGTAMARGEVVSGDYVLIMNNSPVAAWASMVVQV